MLAVIEHMWVGCVQSIKDEMRSEQGTQRVLPTISPANQDQDHATSQSFVFHPGVHNVILRDEAPRSMHHFNAKLAIYVKSGLHGSSDRGL